MDSQPSPKILLGHFNWTIQRLDDILKQGKTVYYRDAALQRFGFTYDMAMKNLLAIAAAQGQRCETPGECLDLAAKMGWLEESGDWRDIANSYDKMKLLSKKEDPRASGPETAGPSPSAGSPNTLAEEIYAKLNYYRVVFQKLHRNLSRIC